MFQLALRRLVVYASLLTLVVANLAPAAFGAATVFTVKKPRKCPAGKVAKRAKKRVKVRVAVRSHGHVVAHRKVWRKRWRWSCVAHKAVGAGPAADVVAPSTPASLAATATDRKVVLLWNAATDNVGVTAYRVYRDGVLAATVSTTTFTDPGLTNGVAHTYLVVAVDGAGNASTPAAVIATAGGVKDTVPPGAPPNFVAAAGDRQVALTWDPSTDNTKVVFYQVFRDGIPIGAQEGRTFTDTGLVNGQTYTYTVIAHDTADNTSSASSAAATPGDATPPGAPTGLGAVALNAGVSLTWTAPTDNVAVTGYKVYRSSGGGSYALIASPTTAYFADSGLTNNTAYSYKVSAVDAAGNTSPQSAIAAATPSAGADTQAPSVPGAPAATPGSKQVSLTWSPSIDNVAVAGYRVLRNGVQVGAPSGTSFTDTGLTNGTSYSYTVAAVDAAGNASAPSSATSATPLDATPPSTPGGLGATGGNAQVALTWTAATDNVGVTGYRVYRSTTGAGGTYTQLATPTGTFYTDTVVTNGSSYSYRVAAVDLAGNVSAQSAVATATPAAGADVQAPSTPGTPAATAGTNQVSLTWTPSTDNVGVTGYKVYRSSGGGGYVQVAAPVSTAFTDAGLANGTAYSYKISAVDAAANESPQSVAATATPVDGQPPTTPTGLSATAGTNQVALAWTASSDNVAVTGYRVYRSSGGGAYAQIATPTSAFYTDTAVTAGTAYSYRIAAVDAAANLSPQTAPVTATPTSAGDTVAPSTPTGLVATGGTAQVSLTWTVSTDNVGVTGYTVYRSTGGGAYAQVGTPVGASYTDTGLTNGTTYSYKVAATDAAGNTSAQSAAASAAPGDTTPPSTPSIIAVTKDGAAHTITITWNAATDNVAVVKYKVYRSTNGGTAVVAGQPSGLSYLENNLSNGATYAYQVTAVDAAGNESAKSPVVSTYVS